MITADPVALVKLKTTFTHYGRNMQDFFPSEKNNYTLQIYTKITCYSLYPEVGILLIKSNNHYLQCACIFDVLSECIKNALMFTV